MSSYTILVVDDERTLARSIRLFLVEEGYEAEVAATAEEALERVEHLHPDLVFLDVRLPGGSGIELLERIKEYDPEIVVIVMTAHGSIQEAVEAMRLGAFDYLTKPVDLEELKILTERARDTYRAQRELAYYRRRAGRELPREGVIGESPPMRQLLERMRQIARLDESPPILLTGETGTGKGLIARALHAQSRRASRPFIEIDCTALPPTLVEAELFGYERGAFTDARRSKMGLFEAADGGFLFLDEIGDLELPLQAKLLRAIEERTVRRIGGIRDRRIDVRILAASNRDLVSEVEAGRFRKDLYFRLAVLLLPIPPLRERGGDIPLLARHFLRTFAARYGKRIATISEPSEDLLRRYTWPGNVRELRHVIERAVLWSEGPSLEPDHLALAIGRTVGLAGEGAPPAGAGTPSSGAALPGTGTATGVPPAAGPVPAAAAPDAPVPAGPLAPRGVDLAQLERRLIQQALREARGNRTRAAKLLGLTRDALRYRLKKFGLSD